MISVERMPFPADLPAAARRNLEAADALNTGQHRGVAGYLYGIAAECAVKAMVKELGLREDEIFYAHFPDLRKLLRDRLKGRKSAPLNALIQDDRFLNNWHISMRYANAREIQDSWVQAWREHARKAITTMGTLG